MGVPSRLARVHVRWDIREATANFIKAAYDLFKLHSGYCFTSVCIKPLDYKHLIALRIVYDKVTIIDHQKTSKYNLDLSRRHTSTYIMLLC